MLLDFTPLLSGEKERIDFRGSFRPSSGLEQSDISFSADGCLSGYADDSAGYISLRLHVSLPYVTHCARCLKELSETLEFDYTCGVSDVPLSEENLDYEILSDGKLDLDEIAVRCAILELPMTSYCSTDCKGLCPKCGKDLNLGDCGCKPDTDPRMQKLIDAINKRSGA